MSPTSEPAARYEVKLVLDALAFARIRGELSLNACALRRRHPERVVQSLYFESTKARSDPTEGSSELAKLRLRWYGDAAGSVSARLEEKSRRGELSFKRGVELERALEIEGAQPSWLWRRAGALVPPRWREHLARAECPTQWLAYRREYWETASGRVRVTIDRELRAWDQRFRSRIERREPTPLPDVTIVELKAPPDAYDELRELCSALSARPERCSKLGLATNPRLLHTVTDFC